MIGNMVENNTPETPSRIEPCFLEEARGELLDLVAELPALASRLGARLHPRTAENLAGLVRIMNCYYSNLIEGNNTRPRDIERALANDLDTDERRRSLQLEAKAHVRVQAIIDREFAAGTLGAPASAAFVKRLHREFYHDAPEDTLRIKGAGRAFMMVPGSFRNDPAHDVSVGRHVPPSSPAVEAFMAHFEKRYGERAGMAERLLALPAAHHRLNYIHPFPDGNGRVSRLMSHAMALQAGIGAHGLWSISRGLARGLGGGIEGKGEYKRMMDHADTPRQGDLDGRGNLSARALTEFSLWFLKLCRDQIIFMSGLFDLDGLSQRLRDFAGQMRLRPEAGRLLAETLHRGEIARGDVAGATGLGERTARTMLAELLDRKVLGAQSAKGPVSLRFPADALDVLFPRLFAES